MYGAMVRYITSYISTGCESFKASANITVSVTRRCVSQLAPGDSQCSMDHNGSVLYYKSCSFDCVLCQLRVFVLHK